MAATQKDTAKTLKKNFDKQPDFIKTDFLENKLGRMLKSAAPKAGDTTADGTSASTPASIAEIISSVSTQAVEGVKAIKRGRGQEISSLASHGGGRGFTGSMSSLRKVALQGNKILKDIHTELKKPQGGLA